MANWYVTIYLLPLLLSLSKQHAESGCCDNVRCSKTLDCGTNRTIVRADPSNCVCCDRCSLKHGEPCIPEPSQDFCEPGLTCYAIDENGERGNCTSDVSIGDSNYNDLDTDPEPDVESEVEFCSVEECERILRCPADSKLVLDQPSGGIFLQTDNSSTDASTYVDSADCCKRRFAPKCRCDYRQCPTVADVTVKHCLNNPQVTTGEAESCCAQFARCVQLANPRTKVSNLPPTPKANSTCSNWVDKSNNVIILSNRSQSAVELCGGSTRLPKCARSWLELSLQQSSERASQCCAELKCSTQRGIVCEPARCPQELHFTAALLTNLEACACVRLIDDSSQMARLEVCPQRLCASHPTKCYQHTHVSDEASCPICLSTEVPCNASVAPLENGKVCDDVKTGRHFIGERWYSESCGNCYCTSDGIAKCEIRDCSQTANREWVSANITMVLACAALTISTIVLIYIVVRKLRNRKWKTRQAAALEKTHRNGCPHGDYREINWGFINVPRTNAAGYAMVERHRRTPGSAIWQRATDVSPGELVYVALNGNSEFQTGFTSPQTATTAMESASGGTRSTVV